MLAFHLPLQGGERAGATARQSGGPVRAQRLHPHRSCRQDHPRHAAGRDGPGRLYRDRNDPRRRARCRFRAGRRWSTRRRTTSSTAIRFSASRSPAIPIPSARSGNHCAMPARRRARCWCRPRHSNGRSIPQAAPASNGRVSHAASGRTLGYGDLADAAEQCSDAARSAAQGPKRFRADRQAAQAPRHARQGQRQGHLRHRRDASRHEVRDNRRKSGIRRQGRSCRR